MAPIDYPMRIRIELFPPNKATRDIDNYVKPILDGLKFLELILDDSLITVLVIIKNNPINKYNKGVALVRIKPDLGKIHNRNMLKMIDEYFEYCAFDDEDKNEFIQESKAYLKRMNKGLIV